MLDVADIAIANSTVAVHVADQEASACLRGGQGVALSVCESFGSTLTLASLPQLVVASSAPVTSLLKVKPISRRFSLLRSSTPGSGISRMLCRSVHSRERTLQREVAATAAADCAVDTHREVVGLAREQDRRV